MEQVNFRTHLHATENETSARCHWHVPETHFLETWSDVRGYDGTVTIMQPLIQPLYNSKSAHEMVGTLIGESGQPPLTTIRKYWEQQPALAAGSFDENCRPRSTMVSSATPNSLVVLPRSPARYASLPLRGNTLVTMNSNSKCAPIPLFGMAVLPIMAGCRRRRIR